MDRARPDRGRDQLGHREHDQRPAKKRGTREAIEWASRCPGSENEVIELRQVMEFSDFTADVQEAAAGFNELKGS